jgi:hypothetical protein
MVLPVSVAASGAWVGWFLKYRSVQYAEVVVVVAISATGTPFKLILKISAGYWCHHGSIA